MDLNLCKTHMRLCPPLVMQWRETFILHPCSRLTKARHSLPSVLQQRLGSSGQSSRFAEIERALLQKASETSVRG